MTVKEIIRKYLENHKCDGLAGNDCGCCMNDLFPCDSYFGECAPGYAVKCLACGNDIMSDTRDDIEGCIYC